MARFESLSVFEFELEDQRPRGLCDCGDVETEKLVVRAVAILTTNGGTAWFAVVDIEGENPLGWEPGNPAHALRPEDFKGTTFEYRGGLATRIMGPGDSRKLKVVRIEGPL